MTDRQRKVSIWVAVSTIVVSLLATFIVGAVFVTWQIERNNQRMCSLLLITTQPRPAPPSNPAVQPTTEYGRQLQEYNRATGEANAKVGRELVALAESYKCGPLPRGTLSRKNPPGGVRDTERKASE